MARDEVAQCGFLDRPRYAAFSMTGVEDLIAVSCSDLKAVQDRSASVSLPYHDVLIKIAP